MRVTLFSVSMREGKYNIIVERKSDENVNSLYRRFSKKMKISGIALSLKQNKFRTRLPSKAVRKKNCINKLRRKTNYELLYRMGKVSNISSHRSSNNQKRF